MSTLSKRRRVEHLKHELAHLESMPEVPTLIVRVDKLGRKSRRKGFADHTARQNQRIAVLRDKLIPKAERNVA